MRGGLVDDAFRFDGGWFLSILQHGYVVTDTSFETQQNVAFFPGLVWVTEPFSWILGDRASAILVANVSALVAFITVYGAIKCITSSDQVARRSVIGLAVWPASIVMTAYYSEGLFIAATAAAIWAAGRDRHAVGCAAAFAAGITRSIGFLLGPALAVARCFRLRRVDRVAVAYAASGPVGLGVVAATQAAAVDDPTAFAKAQEGWDRALSAPWEPIYRATDGIIDKLPKPAMELGLNLVAIVLVGTALVVLTMHLVDRKAAWGLLSWGWVAWFTPLWTAVPSSHVRFALAA